MKLVLASGSPRRKELLEMLGLEFEICPAKGEEKTEEGLSPREIVTALASAKAKEVAAKYPEDTAVIAADTIVWADEQMLGKPRNEADAVRMLELLSGKTHSVFTGICVAFGGEMLTCAEETGVCFRKLGRDEIEAYVSTGEPMDKAGAYGIQGLAGIFVRELRGDYFNVVGLPICALTELLRSFGLRILE